MSAATSAVDEMCRETERRARAYADLRATLAELVDALTTRPCPAQRIHAAIERAKVALL